LAIDGKPDTFGILRPELVNPQRSQKANDTVRNACRDFGQRMVLGDFRVRQRIQPPADMRELTLGHETAKVFRVDAAHLRVSETDETDLRQKLSGIGFDTLDRPNPSNQ